MSISWDDLLADGDDNNDNNFSSVKEEKYLPAAEELICALDEIKHIPQKELYRLIVDGQFHEEEKGWIEYAKREPHSLPACFNAFQAALENLTDSHLSIDIIKLIHQTATINVQRLNAHTKPGEFRTNQGGFFLMQGAHPFLSKEGFIQLLKKVNEECIQYGACITSMTKSDAMSLNSSEYYEKVAKMQHSSKSADQLWEELTDFFQSHILFYRAPHAEHLQFILQKICDQYNIDINKTIVPEEKLKIIANTIQAIEQLHVFPDANGRTSLILLQRLLIQNGFYPVMLYNPNYIDGYSLTELMDELKLGCYHTKTIIQNPDQAIHNYRTEIFTIDTDIMKNYYTAENQLYNSLQAAFTLKKYKI